MYNSEPPLDLEQQVQMMKRYLNFRHTKRIREFLKYAGYFRTSRYGKYLLSKAGVFGSRADIGLFFSVYEFDSKLRQLLFKYCVKAEIYVKSCISNAVSLKTGDAGFYLDKLCYTPSKSERDKKTRNKNVSFFNSHFFPGITKQEKELRGDLRKEVLDYAYSGKNYKKEVTKQMDTWLDAIRNLRNYCAHHSMVIGMTSSIVIPDNRDDERLLSDHTNLYSRLYALKKVLPRKDADALGEELERLIRKSNIDIYKMGILPSEWHDLYNKVIYL